jgi:hypothetical protein
VVLTETEVTADGIVPGWVRAGAAEGRADWVGCIGGRWVSHDAEAVGEASPAIWAALDEIGG